MNKATMVRFATAVLLVVATGIAQAQPDLQVTAVEVACSLTLPTAPAGTMTRFVQPRCDTNHQAELSVVIENKGTSDAVLTAGEIWNLTGAPASAPIAAFIANPSNQMYYPPINVTQSGPLPGQMVVVPKSRTLTLRPGSRIAEVVVLVPARQLTVGSHRFSVRADPQNKVAESAENNNSSNYVTLEVKAPPPDDEWVGCPSVGVQTRVQIEFKQGKFTCTYWDWDEAQVLRTQTVESQYQKPWRSCLRGNALANNATAAGNEWKNETRMFCSFVKSPRELVNESVAWQAGAPAARRVNFGYRRTPAGTERFNICRVRYAGSLRVGRAWRDRCYIPYQNAEQRIDTGIEYLVMTRDYGLPTGVVSNDFDETRNVQPLVDSNPNIPPGLEIRFCSIFLRPDDFAQTLGLAPDLTLEVPGILLPGNVCVSSAQGKAVDSTVATHKLHGGHILILR